MGQWPRVQASAWRSAADPRPRLGRPVRAEAKGEPQQHQQVNFQTYMVNNQQLNVERAYQL